MNALPALLAGQALPPQQVQGLLVALQALLGAQKTEATMVTIPKSKKKKDAGGKIVVAKRPVNSWMAFRSYYNRLFPGYQQKDISVFTHRMWSEDPYKTKWALIAKAYSIIRDRGWQDQMHLLTHFLVSSVLTLELLRPAAYFQTMGLGLANCREGTWPYLHPFYEQLRTHYYQICSSSG